MRWSTRTNVAGTSNQFIERIEACSTEAPHRFQRARGGGEVRCERRAALVVAFVVGRWHRFAKSGVRRSAEALDTQPPVLVHRLNRGYAQALASRTKRIPPAPGRRPRSSSWSRVRSAATRSRRCPTPGSGTSLSSNEPGRFPEPVSGKARRQGRSQQCEQAAPHWQAQMLWLRGGATTVRGALNTAPTISTPVPSAGAGMLAPRAWLLTPDTAKHSDAASAAASASPPPSGIGAVPRPSAR